MLLFVISNESRSLVSMTLAAHYIGSQYNVVLYIKEIEDGCIIGKDQVGF